MLTSANTQLAGFEHITTYFDKKHQIKTAKLLPGEYYVTPHAEAITTVLGSCVAACVRDTRYGIGGMNHFMLPIQDDCQQWKSSVVDRVTRYGNYAMEHLINTILSNGGQRKFLEVKVFGGGSILAGLSDIGACNVRFVLDYLAMESLPLAAKDVCGAYPRKVFYFPKTGRVLLKRLEKLHNSTLYEREVQYRHQIQDEPVEGGEVDLF